jgi:hypothetical protein
MSTIKTNVYYYVDDVTGKKVYDTEEMRQEFEQSLSNLETAPEVTASRFPFEEGEHYFTIETNTIVESCWDAQSEELYKADKMYFKTMNEAIFYHQYRKTLSMLLHAVSVIELDCDTADGNEFLERFERFNPTPKLSLL